MGACFSVEIEARSESRLRSIANSGRNSSSLDRFNKSFTRHPSMHSVRRFRYGELQAATNQFDESLVLGEGAFGKVYRGELENISGKESVQGSVAIKKLKKESIQGYKDWLNELLVLQGLEHPNLVSLVGYSMDQGVPLLVYNFYSCGSLDQNMFGVDKPLLSWDQRVDIALNAARGLAYLHGKNIIHRDFKPSNILLSEDYSPHITDFGMARPGPDGNESHISTHVMGTLGFLDPTYMETGKLTMKSDTYAFGVMLLELLTGRRAMGADGKDSLVLWVQPIFAQSKPDLTVLIDPRLEGNFSEDGAVKLATVAKCCTHDDPLHRPPMGVVAENLELVDRIHGQG